MSNFETGEEFAGGFLSHFGIKGMKWGVRRDKGGSSDGGGSGSKKKEEHSEDSEQARASAEKMGKSGVTSLSNKELRQLVDRINLEANVTRLNSPQASKTTSPVKTGINFLTGKGVKYSNMYMDTLVQMKMKEQIQSQFGAKKAG